ncbi:MAG: ABC transporter permease [Deltaproteobacteria bacterium]|nr:ABC transporter permease [Deltaproteobacteria bacterium]
MTMLVALGEAVGRRAGDIGALLLSARRALIAGSRLRVDLTETLRQTDRLFVDALPLFTVASVAVGGVVAMQGLNYVARYSASEVFGWAAAMSAYRDVGPLLLGCGLAARVGARTTAELAVMAARDRLDAVRALGIDPEPAVVWPRLVATVACSVLFWAPACTLVLAVAFVVASLVGDQRLATSVWSVASYVHASTLLQGLVRMVLFGVVVGLASCHAGVAVATSEDRSAGAIGRAVYAGAVLSLAGVVMTNAVLSLLGGTG